MREYYVYEWIRLDTNEPFYVGKGKGNRWKDFRRSKYFKNIINKTSVAVNILHDELDEQTAFDLECWYIHEYIFDYGYTLTNLTWGGEGTSPTEEVRKKMSESKKGSKNAMYGRNIYEEMSIEEKEKLKKKISKSNLGKGTKSMLVVLDGETYEQPSIGDMRYFLLKNYNIPIQHLLRRDGVSKDIRDRVSLVVVQGREIWNDEIRQQIEEQEKGKVNKSYKKSVIVIDQNEYSFDTLTELIDTMRKQFSIYGIRKWYKKKRIPTYAKEKYKVSELRIGDIVIK